MKHNTVVIMRGVSGSGKDTWIRENIGSARICSADDFFMKDDEYMFDVGRLPEAHVWCMTRFLKAIQEHVPTIVVNNTHTRCWEWENYARAALNAGYDVEVVSLECTSLDQVRKCCSRNVHEVPGGVICSAAMRFEDTVTKCAGDLVNRIKSIVVPV